jgi:hypothetical protein
MDAYKTNITFAIIAATLVLALVSVSYIESVSADHKLNGHEGKVRGCITNGDGCVDDPAGDQDPDDDAPDPGELDDQD